MFKNKNITRGEFKKKGNTETKMGKKGEKRRKDNLPIKFFKIKQVFEFLFCR